MYRSVYYDREDKTIHVWDDEKGYYTKKYFNYCYRIVNDGKTDYRTIFGDRVKKIKNSYDTKDFEIDVSPIMRFLIDNYYQSNEVAKNNILFFDIETDSKNGYPDIEEADKAIISNSFHFNGQNYCFILNKTKQKIKKFKNVIVTEFTNEEKLIDAFILFLRDNDISILVDWNGDEFDLKYIINRMKAKSMKWRKISPIGVVDISFGGYYKIAGIEHMDYMKLYKKYSVNDRASYSLNFIANYELEIEKVKHQGLDKLYEEDINKFIEYNVRDVEIIVELEKKLSYLEIAISLAHNSHIPYEWIFPQSKIVEGYIFTYFKRNNLVSINNFNKDNHGDEKFRGAYVKEPVKGRWKNLMVYDVNSLYPTLGRDLNLSPETKIGRVMNWDNKAIINFYNLNKGNNYENLELELHNGKIVTLEWLAKYLKEKNYSISCIGLISDLNEDGFIRKIFTEMFEDRVKFDTLKKKYAKEKNEDLKKINHIKQYTMKILLNSVYGYLGLPTGRFFDVDLAESITITGQYLIKFASNRINEFLGGSNVIYNDTDSVIINTEKENESGITKFNAEMLNDFAENVLNVKNTKLNLKFEDFYDTGLILAKKKYAFRKNDKPDDDKIAGLDMIKSSFPKAMQTLMKEILSDILDFQDKSVIDSKIFDFKDKMKSFSSYDMAETSGIRNIDKYFDKTNRYKKGSPRHVKASINHNIFLQKNNLDKKYRPIREGDKVKFVYLRENNKYNFETIAFTEDYPQELMDFVDLNIDRNRIFESVLSNKIQAFYEVLDWQMIDLKQQYQIAEHNYF